MPLSLIASIPLLLGQIIIPDGTVPPFPSTLETHPIYRSTLTPNNPNSKAPSIRWDDPLLHKRIKWVWDTVRSLGVNPTGYSINPRFSGAEGGAPREAMITWGAEYGGADIPIVQFYLNPSISAVILAGNSNAQFKTWPYYAAELETQDVSVRVPVCEPWPELARELYPDPSFDTNNVRKPCPDDKRPEGDMFPMQLSPGASLSVFKKYRRPRALGVLGGFAWTPDNPALAGGPVYYWLNIGYGTSGRSDIQFNPESTVRFNPGSAGLDITAPPAPPARNRLQWANPKSPQPGQVRSRVAGKYQVTEVYNERTKRWDRLSIDEIGSQQ